MKNILKALLLFSILTLSTLYAIQENNNQYNEQSQKLIMKNGYNAIIASQKPLKNGKNKLSVTILKNNAVVKNADVNIIFELENASNVEFSEHAVEKENTYKLTANFKSKGKWKYELMFKTDYGAIYSQEGKLTIH